MSEKSWDKSKVVSNEKTIQSSYNKLDNTVYTLSEALSSVDEAVIRGSVIKAYDLKEKILFLVLMKTAILWSHALAQVTFLIILRSTKRNLLNVALIAWDTMLIDFAAMQYLFLFKRNVSKNILVLVQKVR